MDLHRRRRWHSPKISPSTSTTASSNSVQNINDHIFSQVNSDKVGASAAFAANYKNKNNNYNVNNNKNNEEGEYDSEDDLFSNILSLKLRKPKHWKWELTTSKSCSNIAIPRILLYDHKGNLLVDAQGEDKGVYRQEDYEKQRCGKPTIHSYDQNYKQQQQRQKSKSATSNLTESIREVLDNKFIDLEIQEATPSPGSYSKASSTSTANRPHHSPTAIDLNTTDLSDFDALSRRSSSLRGVQIDVIDEEPYIESKIPEFLITPSSTTTTPTSSSSEPRVKHKYRRSRSSGKSSTQSESILERLSYQKCRFSSPEYEEEQQEEYHPRYFLRTCKAGTLVVQEDSFRRHPTRRRRRSQNRQSTESLQSSLKSQHSPTPSLGAVDVDKERITDNVRSRNLRKYTQANSETKDLSCPPNVHQKGKVR